MSGLPKRVIASSSAATQNSASIVFDSRQARTFAAGPVHDRDEVEEAAPHRDVGDIRTPDMVRLVDGHPLRVRHWRVLNIALLAAWAALAFLAVINDLAPGPYVTWPLVAIAIYFFGAGLLRRPA